MRINFDFTDLEAFLAVISTGSFHTASETLGLSQSSVTRRIQKLEQALDVVLFERTTRAVKPTLAGKRLKVRAESILSETLETQLALHDETVAFAHQRARTVTIATIPTVVQSIIAPALKAFRESDPEVRFRILDLPANEVAEAVVQGDADFGVCSVPAFEPATNFELLFVDEMVAALPSNHPLIEEEQLTWTQVSQEVLILPMRGTGNRMLIDDALARAGLPKVWAFEVGRTATALGLVAQGLGLAPVPNSATEGEREQSVVTRPILSPQISRPVGFLSRAGQSLTPAHMQIKSALFQACEYL